MDKREPLESDWVFFQQIEQRLRWFSVKDHEMVVRVVLEQPGPGFEDLTVVLDQPLRAGPFSLPF